MSETGDYQSQQLLSSSTSSLSSNSSAKHVSQIYKQASQLFLTRRLQESLAAIEPIISPSFQDGEATPISDSNKPLPAPVATASDNLRIRVWNLYVTLLSAIVELGPDEGKREFSQRAWKSISSMVRDGNIWETVVQAGYGGNEGSVDTDVVYNLATLLLNHSPSQKLNQQRLESYLSSSTYPLLDVAGHIQQQNNSSSAVVSRKRAIRAGGTDTPKDLTARIRLIELFTLHVLPRNGEWEYAREFVNLSEHLDDERKEAFLQTLDALHEEQELGSQRAAEIQRERDEELERQRREQKEEEAVRELQRQKAEAAQNKEDERERRIGEPTTSAGGGPNLTATKKLVNGHYRTSSEVDYGIEKAHPNGVPKQQRSTKPAIKQTRQQAASSRTQQQPISESSPKQGAKKREASKQILPLRRLRMLGSLLVGLMRRLGRALSGNPLAFLRAVLLVMGVLMALSRPDIRDRIRRAAGLGWHKVRGTVGMGVKVTYI